MMRDSAFQTIEHPKPGDHLCCIYRSEEEHRRSEKFNLLTRHDTYTSGRRWRLWATWSHFTGITQHQAVKANETEPA